MGDAIDWNGRFELPDVTVRYRWQGVPAGIEHVRDVVFHVADGVPLHLDIFLPEHRPEPLPTIVWIGGGGWKGMSPKGVEIVAAWLAARGCAMVGVQYRVSGEARFPAQIADIKSGVRWLRAHAERYNLDASRIGAWGDSAGGHLVELLGTASGVAALAGDGPHAEFSDAVSAVCAFYPPSDMRPFAVQEEFAGLFVDTPDKGRWVALASPLDHVSADAPPHLLVHGSDDEIVPLEHSYRFQDALHAVGVECTLAVLPGVKHDGRTLYGAVEVQRLVEAFFVRHLGLAGAPLRS